MSSQQAAASDLRQLLPSTIEWVAERAPRDAVCRHD